MPLRSTILTEADLAAALAEATILRERMIRRNRTLDHGGPMNGRTMAKRFENWREGTLAEIAFGRLTGKPWRPSAEEITDTGDIGGVEVRYTHHMTGRLIVWLNDRMNKPCVLMVGSYPRISEAGWCHAGRGRALGEYREGPTNMDNENYWVNQRYLLPWNYETPPWPGSKAEMGFRLMSNTEWMAAVRQSSSLSSQAS